MDIFHLLSSATRLASCVNENDNLQLAIRTLRKFLFLLSCGPNSFDKMLVRVLLKLMSSFYTWPKIIYVNYYLIKMYNLAYHMLKNDIVERESIKDMWNDTFLNQLLYGSCILFFRIIVFKCLFRLYSLLTKHVIVPWARWPPYVIHGYAQKINKYHGRPKIVAYVLHHSV